VVESLSARKIENRIREYEMPAQPSPLDPLVIDTLLHCAKHRIVLNNEATTSIQ